MAFGTDRRLIFRMEKLVGSGIRGQGSGVRDRGSGIGGYWKKNQMNRGSDVQAYDILGLLKGKLDAFEVFLSTTVLLRDADLQDMGKIERFIEKRENCIKVIEKIDSRINRLRNSIPALPGEIAKRIRMLAKAIDDTAAETTHLNKEFETMFMFHHNKLKNRLSKTRHSRNGVKNYAIMAYGENQPRFLDVTS